jgi:hypothetical protein
MTQPVVIVYKCSRCRSSKPCDMFVKGNDIMKTCSTCRTSKDRAEYMRIYRANNPEKKDTRYKNQATKDYMKAYRLKMKALKTQKL